MADMSFFIYLSRPVRSNFIENISGEEEVILGEHFHYLEKALAEGRLVLAAMKKRYTCMNCDGSFSVEKIRCYHCQKEW